MTAVVAAQVAFWRQIPVVHLQAGVATRRPALPVPAGGEPARHRPAGLAVPHHRRCGARQPDRAQLDPRRRHDGREPRSQPTCASPGSSAGCGRGGRGWSWSGLDRPDSLGVLASLPELLDREPDIEVVVFGRLAAHGAAHSLALHERAVVVRTVPASELLGLITASTRARLRRPGAGRRTRPGSARRPCWSTARTSRSRATRSAASSALRSWTRSGRCSPPARVRLRSPSDGLEALRVEQAVAWMFGLTPVAAARTRRTRPARGDSRRLGCRRAALGRRPAQGARGRAAGARPVGPGDAPALQHRRPARPLLPRLPELPLHPHRPEAAAGRADDSRSSPRATSRSSCIRASSCWGRRSRRSPCRTTWPAGWRARPSPSELRWRRSPVGGRWDRCGSAIWCSGWTDGRLAVVAATEIMSGRPCYEVCFSDGQTIIADAAHLWRTTTKSARKHGGPSQDRDDGPRSRRHVAGRGGVEPPRRARRSCAVPRAAVAGRPVRSRHLARRRHEQLGRGDGGPRRRADAPGTQIRSAACGGPSSFPVRLPAGRPSIRRLALLQGLMDSDGYIDEFGRCEFVSIRECLVGRRRRVGGEPRASAGEAEEDGEVPRASSTVSPTR